MQAATAFTENETVVSSERVAFKALLVCGIFTDSLETNPSNGAPEVPDLAAVHRQSLYHVWAARHAVETLTL